MSAAPPLPTPDEDSQRFWAGCRDGHLSAQQCPACSRFRWPPMEFCPHCHRQGGDWRKLPGTGVVRAFVVVHRAFDPGFEDKVPYVVAHIALDGAEGVTIIGNVQAAADRAVAVGDRVAVEFETVGPVAMPRFRPI